MSKWKPLSWEVFRGHRRAEGVAGMYSIKKKSGLARFVTWYRPAGFVTDCKVIGEAASYAAAQKNADKHNQGILEKWIGEVVL